MKSEGQGHTTVSGVWSTRKVACLIALIMWAAAAAGVAAAQGDNVTMTIVSPQNQETIHSNVGSVPVTVNLPAGGDVAAGNAIRVLLDGRDFGPLQHTRSFVLNGVERGEHTLQVLLLDASGNATASSGSVTFYLWQASALFPGRR